MANLLNLAFIDYQNALDGDAPSPKLNIYSWLGRKLIDKRIKLLELMETLHYDL